MSELRIMNLIKAEYAHFNNVLIMCHLCLLYVIREYQKYLKTLGRYNLCVVKTQK